MRFFRKLLGSSSNSGKKNDYARATLEYATSPQIIETNAIVYSNRSSAFEPEGKYGRPVSDYSRTLEINAMGAIELMNLGGRGLHKQRITITSYKSYKSKTDLSIRHP